MGRSTPHFISASRLGLRGDLNSFTTRRTRKSPSRRAMERPAYGVNLLTKMLDGPPPSVDPKADRNSFPSFARPM